MAQESQPATAKATLVTRNAQDERIVPFYGLYCWASDFESPRYLDLVKQTGFRLISTAVNAEQEPGMLVAARNGVQMAGYFSPNRWARTMDTDGYRQAVREAVRRYGPGGSLWKEHPDVPATGIVYWVIDGEPGTEIKPEGDMMPDEAYVACLKVAWEEIKAYNKDCKIVAMAPIGCVDGALPGPNYVDKSRKIMGGQAFIRAVHERGGFAWYDCIDLHPFSFPQPPDTAGLAKTLRWVKDECRKYGKEKPIWFTEIGFPMAYGPANPFHVTQDQAADYTARALALSARYDVQCLTLTYVNDQMSPRREQGYYLYKAYGFYKNGKMRLAAKITRLMAGLMPDPVLLEIVSDGENVGQAAARWSDRPYDDSPFYCYKFRGRNNSEVTVLWTEGRTFRYNLKVPNDKMTLYNRELLGGIVYSKAGGSINAGGEMRVPVTGTPLFVSTEVSPEQEQATENYLRPAKIGDWKAIEGSEN
jgi:hypothetical protein